MVINAISQFSKNIRNKFLFLFENFIKPGAQMHVCNENMNAMLVLKFPKQNIYIFQKVFDFSEFSKSLKILGCYTNIKTGKK